MARLVSHGRPGRHPGPSAAGLPIAAGAKVIDALGEAVFPEVFLAATAEALDVDLCSAFALEAPGKVRFLFAAGWTAGSTDFARTASMGYAATYWRADPVMAKLPDAALPPSILCQRWDMIPDDHYRQVCYEAPGVVERLSIRGRTGTGLIQIGLYRLRNKGFFAAADLRRVQHVGDVLISLAAKHVAMTMLRAPAALSPDRAAVTCQVARLGSQLSLREAEICAALLCGHTAKETARLAGLEPSSVITYRKRAFQKLGVATLRELRLRYEEACPTP